MSGYIDTHNHILPGLDDGPATIKEAVEMARVAQKNGITKIVATPHYNDFHHPPKNEILASFELLRSSLKKNDVPVDIYPGNELRISLELPVELREGRVLSLAGSTYILLEFPFDGTPLFAEEIIFRLRTDGWIPILAHMERIYDIQRNPSRTQRYIDMGCMIQVNSNSLSGELGRASLDIAIEFLKEGYVDVLASDAHASGRPIPDFTGALQIAEKYIGKDEARKLVVDNPGKIFSEGQ